MAWQMCQTWCEVSPPGVGVARIEWQNPALRRANGSWIAVVAISMASDQKGLILAGEGGSARPPACAR